jgi:dephospho-CoA kinase
MKVAVTGGVGSGKSVVCSIFSEYGFVLVSSDELARQVVRTGFPAYQRIIAKFGKGVVLENGTLNRRKLREMIIEDPEAKRTLEEILHPEIIRMMDQRLSDAQKAGKSIVVEIPLLFELNLEDRFDIIVTVSSPYENRIQRLVVRDRIKRCAAEKLIRTQMPENEKAKRSDIVIKNDGSMDQLKNKTRRICKKILNGVNFDECS